VTWRVVATRVLAGAVRFARSSCRQHGVTGLFAERPARNDLLAARRIELVLGLPLGLAGLAGLMSWATKACRRCRRNRAGTAGRPSPAGPGWPGSWHRWWPAGSQILVLALERVAGHDVSAALAPPLALTSSTMDSGVHAPRRGGMSWARALPQLAATSRTDVIRRISFMGLLQQIWKHRMGGRQTSAIRRDAACAPTMAGHFDSAVRNLTLRLRRNAAPS